MLSYTALRNKFGVLVNNTNSTVLTNADNWINDAQRIFITETNGYFLEASATDTTVASQQNYDTPYNYEKMDSITITIGDFIYPIKEITDRHVWNDINLNSGTTADPPEYYFINAGQVYFWPAPSTAGYTITFYYKKLVRNLSNADYTTGTVTLANGSTAVTGSGTTFTAGMVGRYLKGDNDGFWYEIASFTDATNITLDKEWQGTGASGLSYTIGEMPVIPEAFHPNLVDYAVAEYWDMSGRPKRSAIYRAKWQEALRKGKIDASNKTNNMVINDGDGVEFINPNLHIEL